MCGEGAVPAANLYKDQPLYDALVGAFSMRGFVASAGASLGMTISSTLSRSSAARIQTGFLRKHSSVTRERHPIRVWWP